MVRIGNARLIAVLELIYDIARDTAHKSDTVRLGHAGSYISHHKRGLLRPEHYCCHILRSLLIGIINDGKIYLRILLRNCQKRIRTLVTHAPAQRVAILRKLAEVIQNCCFNGRICSRFGGDEFIIFGKTDSDDDVIVLENEFKRQLAAMNAILSKPYSIDASIGTIVSTVEPDMKLFSLITKADQIMYERKKKKKTSRYLRR